MHSDMHLLDLSFCLKIYVANEIVLYSLFKVSRLKLYFINKTLVYINTSNPIL